MTISKERIELILGRFSMLFPLPVEMVNTSDIVDLWFGLFDGCDEQKFMAAARELALSLRRFPFPADFQEKLAQSPANIAQPATESVAEQGVANV